MRNNDARHLFHFIFLLAILSVLSILILAFQYQSLLQLVFVILFASTYVLWGIIHHHKNKDLHPKVVLEYLLIGLIGASVLVTLLLKL